VGLTLDVNFDGFYYRPIMLEATDEVTPRTNWRPVASGQVYRIDRQGVAAEVRHIDYPAAIGRYLRLSIADGDDRPLDVTGQRPSVSKRCWSPKVDISTTRQTMSRCCRKSTVRRTQLRPGQDSRFDCIQFAAGVAPGAPGDQSPV